MFREAAGEPTPNNEGEGGGGDEPWEIRRQNIPGKVSQKASVAEAQGAPGEVDMDKGGWSGRTCIPLACQTVVRG